MPEVKVLAFAGSARRESINTKLLRVAAEGVTAGGGTLTLVDMRDYPMPLYDGDLEEQSGIPDRARAFKQLLIEHHGFLIACPEYNSSFTPLLKNAIDWASRPEANQAPLAAFAGKVAGLVSASAGAMGGYRGLQQVRYVLGNIRTIVLPEMYALGGADQAFDERGAMKDAKKAEMARSVGRNVVETARRLASA
ncbi:MAG: NAD(P)H-dependent oxidoreductase [Phycisphaerales bacterium]|nr:NAD(P)H-dependent oxidoreductase [Phycisphaerales bacterium]MCB9841168.1 NAD(P)H-dependent oxidoreductase [Phycisphaeraceae bacterium]